MVLVALTGWGQEEDRQKSCDAGFNGHMVKPVELDALTKLLAEPNYETGCRTSRSNSTSSTAPPDEVAEALQTVANHALLSFAPSIFCNRR